jgi:hypothetical protein
MPIRRRLSTTDYGKNRTPKPVGSFFLARSYQTLWVCGLANGLSFLSVDLERRYIAWFVGTNSRF